MESGLSSNLTFLIAPIDAWLIPTIAKITVSTEIDPMEAWLVLTNVMSIVTVVATDVIFSIQKAKLLVNIVVAIATTCCLSQSPHHLWKM